MAGALSWCRSPLHRSSPAHPTGAQRGLPVTTAGGERGWIERWFRELEHFGFIVMSSPGCLGVEGKGKAPHWRLTECGTTSKTSATGVWEPPTNDFLRWDGTPFRDPKTKPWLPRGSQRGDHRVASGGDPSSPLNLASGDRGVAIQGQGSGDPVVAISSLPLGGRLPASAAVIPATPETGKNTRSPLSRKPWTKPRVLSDELINFPESPSDGEAA